VLTERSAISVECSAVFGLVLHDRYSIVFTQPYIAKDFKNVSNGSHDIARDKYGKQHPLSLHPITPSADAAKRKPMACALLVG
jgi:hypothetical protein